MSSTSRPNSISTIAGRLKIWSAVAAGSLLLAGAAAAACPQPRMSQLSERNGPNCGAATCGFIIAHWVGSNGCDHYNIRERSGKQFEAPGIDRNQLINQRSAQFPGRFTPNNTIHVAVQGCTRNFFGVSSCGPFSPEVSFRINDSSPSDKDLEKICAQYARQATTSFDLARNRYKCDPNKISGPRWSPSYAQHLQWCKSATPEQRKVETDERDKIVDECQRSRPDRLILRVSQGRGDFFDLSGSGFHPNQAMIFRIAGPAALSMFIEKLNNQPMMADAQGNFQVRIPGVMVCKKAGAVSFQSVDRHGQRRSNAVVMTCRPN